MDQRLQQAINAARVGNTREAQGLLTQLLKEDPEQVQAWFLLSHLVDSEEKQKAFLGRVLALDPTHTQARQRLAYLHSSDVPVVTEAKTVPTMVVADQMLDVETQSEGDTLPSWMSEDDATVVTVAAPASTPADITETAVSADEELPDWLTQPVGSEWGGEDPEPEASADSVEMGSAAADAAPTEDQPTMPVKAASATVTETSQKSQVTRWNLMLAILIIFAVIVFAFLVYLLFQAL